ncbi:hypothetical protein A7E78_01565 [Syntrophotalea acetylenivorans]|uniref:Acyltransferase n=1 Tax=Syntrophotalea acetylenivorans TaxID=1842532 RepID=A0A1L3GL45_9BACT|nr:acyltransferase [Syntrophotalea acetylenivorans]APG26663.1 hypothetical protein A7E78_01565 [Syntrophotalea acetylenivorans]
MNVKKVLKLLFRLCGVPVLRGIAPLFYKKELLRGRYFDDSLEGWLWVFRGFWFQKILGFNRHLPFPASSHVHVSDPQNLILGSNVLNNFQSFGIYFQNFSGKIHLGNDCYIGPNVGLITANHDLSDPSKHLPGKDIIIGARCWVGMNSVIMPGVVLGEGTVVAAGSVVTKSFPEGNVLLAGSPVKVMKEIINS